MKPGYLLFVSALLASACARECDLAWEASTSETKLQQFGFQVDVGEYIGRGRYKGRTVPGVIKRSDPKTLHFPMGNKHTTTKERVEFLKTNEEYKLTWINAESVCVQDGVVVGKQWYIGMTTDRTSRYLGTKKIVGRIGIGEDQMILADSSGAVAFTEKFHVLTCSYKEDGDCGDGIAEHVKLKKDRLKIKETEIKMQVEDIMRKDDEIKDLQQRLEDLRKNKV